MEKFRRVFILSFTFLLIYGALSACGSAGDMPDTGAPAPGITVTINNSTCPSVVINLNDQITWINADTVDHEIRVQNPSGEEMVFLGDLKSGDSASLAFSESGAFLYTCTRDHPSTGTITVQP